MRYVEEREFHNYGYKKFERKFAWKPKKCMDSSENIVWVWLEFYKAEYTWTIWNEWNHTGNWVLE